ncbi:MAG: alkaline phosphatase [Nitrospirae bacterium]|nr:alkaline phosphatase [Nitrospirota bacterium]
MHPQRMSMVAGAAASLLLVGSALAATSAASPATPPAASAVQPEHVILIVFEGIGQDSLKAGAMPVLGRLVKEGSVTWSATAVTPALRLPTMASLLMGLPVQKHGVTWDSFDFARGYPRPPTVFDYLDLSGGKDSAIFFMDESLYQLAKPEPYTDYQMCGPLKPECSPATVVGYVRDYFRKATSGEGYGHAILSLPHFLVVHLPEPARVGAAGGWNSRVYRDALRTVDSAMGSILDLYRELGLLKKTTVIVTALSSAPSSATSGSQAASKASRESPAPPRVPWIAWGAGIKSGYVIKQPVSIIDTGATVLRTLGLDTHTEWESHAVEEVFKGPRSTTAVAGANGH